jgi:hypothetical protein
MIWQDFSNPFLIALLCNRAGQAGGKKSVFKCLLMDDTKRDLAVDPSGNARENT